MAGAIRQEIHEEHLDPSASILVVSMLDEAAPAINTFAFAGHEADHVYCVSLDYVAKNDENVNPRNRLAVGMTLTGTGSYPLYREVEQVAFTYRERAAGTEEEEKAVSYQQELV